MRAITQRRFGPPEVFELIEAPEPVPLLVRVHASAVTAADVNVRDQSLVPPGLKLVARLMFGLRRPRFPIAGSGLAGEVVARGAKVTRFEVGDRVWGESRTLGAYADLVCLPETGHLGLMPDGLDFESAMALPFGALTAMHFLDTLGGIRAGQRVLVNGASGGVGIYAVQLARHHGAVVTGTCSAAKMDFVATLGADQVLDHERQDFTSTGQTWDVIFDTVGRPPFSRCRSALADGGVYHAVAGGLGDFARALWTARVGKKRVVVGTPPVRRADLEALSALAREGRVRPVIDSVHPLEAIVEAHRRHDSGRKMGAIIISMGRGGDRDARPPERR